MNGRPLLLTLVSWCLFLGCVLPRPGGSASSGGTYPLQVQVMPSAVRAPRANPTVWRAVALNFVAHVGAALRVVFFIGLRTGLGTQLCRTGLPETCDLLPVAWSHPQSGHLSLVHGPSTLARRQSCWRHFFQLKDRAMRTQWV